MQKGFLSGVAGCLEHSFTLFEALREAKEEQRQIVVAWIDLANAYGSVRHNLIQFALNWYHVPIVIQEVIFNYYNKLMATVQTKEWSTGFFLFDIGLFQGCVLSTILFDCIFQLLLDMLEPLNDLGYSFKGINMTNLTQAYADDLCLAAKNPKGLQAACDRTDSFLSWSKTMKAKPRKCITVGYRQFDKRTDSGYYTPHHATRYSAFDPGVSISGHSMKFLFNPNAKKELARDHFKFLGRWIGIDLNEKAVKNSIRKQFIEEVSLIDKSKVNGLMKLWLYQFYVLAHLAWPFLVHDFNYSFSVELQDMISVKLKRWAKLYRGADIGSLFRSRNEFGLNLTSVSQSFTRMQIIKCKILQDSDDPNVRLVYEFRAKKTCAWKVKWSAAKITEEVTADALLNHRFPALIGKRGLGHGDFVANPSTSDVRKMAVSASDRRERERLLAHAHTLERQGVWLGWHDQVEPFDLSWKNLIYGPGPHVIAFVLNATINSLRTPDMLKLWGYKQTDKCLLCGKDNCSLHHILSNCKSALDGGRYTWRHDSILSYLHPLLSDFINHRRQSKLQSTSVQRITFVKQGEGHDSFRNSSRSLSSLLDGANDWQLLVDFSHAKIVFPVEIYATPQRPDVLIWSKSLHKVIIGELTCPAEEGFDAAQARKEARYYSLTKNINDDKNSPWKAILITFEVGARGFVAYSTRKFLQNLAYRAPKLEKLAKISR